MSTGVPRTSSNSGNLREIRHRIHGVATEGRKEYTSAQSHDEVARQKGSVCRGARNFLFRTRLFAVISCLWSVLILFSFLRTFRSLRRLASSVASSFLLAPTRQFRSPDRRNFSFCPRQEKLIGNSGGTVGSVSRIPRRIYLVSRSSARHSLFFALYLSFPFSRMKIVISHWH